MSLAARLAVPLAVCVACSFDPPDRVWPDALPGADDGGGLVGGQGGGPSPGSEAGIPADPDGGPEDTAPPDPGPFTIGGAVKNLKGDAVTLAIGAEVITVRSETPFVFMGKVARNETYDVRVTQHPMNPQQFCVIEGGGKGVATMNVVLTVTCHDYTTVAVDVKGLAADDVLELGDSYGHTLRVTADGKHTFADKSPEGQPYEITIKTEPQKTACTPLAPKGTLPLAGITIEVVCLGEVAPRAAGSNNWMDYYTIGNSPCTARTPGCEHRAEKRKLVVPWLTSCDGVTVEDTLGAFVWSCQPGNPVEVRSLRLKDDRGMRDLIDFGPPPKWRPNGVTVQTAKGTARSKASVWWTNAFADDPQSNVSAAGTVAVARKDVTYYVAGQRVAFVTAPGLVLTAGTPSFGTNVSYQNWIEGDFGRGFSLPNAATLSRSRFVKGAVYLGSNGLLRGVRFEGGERAIESGSAAFNNVIRDLVCANVDTCIRLASGEFHASGLYVTNMRAFGFKRAVIMEGIWSSIGVKQASDLVITNGTFAYGGTAFYTKAAYGLQLRNVTIANVEQGIVNEFGVGVSNGYEWRNLLITNAGTGVSLHATTSVTLGSVMVTHADAAMRWLGKTQSDRTSVNPLVRVFAYGGAAEPCTAEAASMTCTGVTTTPTGNDDGRYFVGTLASPAAVPFAMAPSAALPEGLVVWGKPGGDGPSVATRGACAAGDCVAVSFVLRKGAAALGANPIGTDKLTMHPDALAYAWEPADDESGDDDGRCESGEVCIFSPNIGSYQGHGALGSPVNMGGFLLRSYAENGQ